MRLLTVSVATLSVFALACQTTVNLTGATDTSEKETESSSGSSAGSGDPGTSNPGTTNPSTTDPNTSEPGTTDANTTNPGTTDESTTNPGTTDASTTSPGTTDANTTNPGTTDTTGDTSGGSDTDSTGSSTGGTTGGNADLGDWTKYREVLIDNGLGTELTDFQVAVKVTYDSDMSPDYADLRFTDESGTELLPYWVEWELGPVEAFVWVRVPVLPADDITTIRMYYGNPNAAPASSGFDTFLFFDDFEAGQLDAAKWKATAPVTFESGLLRITRGAVYTNKTAASFPDTTVEVRAVWANQGNVDPGRIGVGQAQVSVPDLVHMWFGGWQTSVYDGEKIIWSQNENPGSPDLMNIWGITADASDVHPRYHRNYSPALDIAVAFNYYLIIGHTSGKLAELQEIRDVDVDWILVRRHADPDPVTLVGGEKQP